MAQSVKQITNSVGGPHGQELYKLLAGMQQDLAALRASIVGVNAKLDADATVTDTNYGSLWNPAALNTTP